MATFETNALEINDLNKNYPGFSLNHLNLTLPSGCILGLIGENGAGKTTVFNLLTGVYKPTEGIITLDGKDITGKKTIDINQAGIARTFQNIRLFKDLSVIDNVKVGLHNHMGYSTITGILRLPKYYKVEKQMTEEAMELLKVFGLEAEADTLADNLPYGKQRKLEIARALATKPKLLLLDEITANLDAQTEEEVLQALKRASEGRTVISISHRVNAETGRIITF